MITRFKPSGVCSRLMEIETDGDVIVELKTSGGCSGNLQAMSSLVKGMKIEEAIKRLSGIRCGFKSTSCPDQFAIALQGVLDKKNND